MISYHIHKSRRVARQCVEEAKDYPDDAKNRIKAILDKQPVKVRRMATEIIKKRLGAESCP